MSTLIECMVAVAIAGVGASLLLGPMSTYEQASARAGTAERAARAIDQDLESLRRCATLACLEAPPAPRADGFTLRREILPDGGPSGTVKVIVSASHPSLRGERKVAALLWVER